MGKNTGGYTHPEKLGSFETAGNIASFINHQVAVIEGLDTEVIKVQVCGGINRLAQLVDIELQQFFVEPIDSHTPLQIGLKLLGVKGTYFFNTVLSHIPSQYFLINISKQD